MSKFFLKSKLSRMIDRRIKTYRLYESDGPFPTEEPNEEEDPMDQEDPNAEMPPAEDLPDPTETPAGEHPDNEDGAYISDNKLSMYASLLLKAYTAKPPTDLPEQFKNVDSNNADEIIKFIEDSLIAGGSQTTIADNLSKI